MYKRDIKTPESKKKIKKIRMTLTYDLHDILIGKGKPFIPSNLTSL